MIACSPSTGSSLLRRLLNRHSKLFCGPESSLLSKDELYANWSLHKNRLLSKRFFGLKERGWHHFRGINIDKEFGVSEKDFHHLLQESNAFDSFLKGFFKFPLLKYDKELWIEKTPSNAFTAKLFLEYFKGGKLIHITRNPYDTIASLVSRGMSVYQSSAVCLLNTCELLKLQNHSSHFLIKFEDLIFYPEKNLTNLLGFLGYEFESQMLVSDDHFNENNYIEGWKYKETDPIGKNSINKFDTLTKDKQREIILTMQVLQSKLHVNINSFEGICKNLNYNYRSEEVNPSFKFKLRFEMLMDKIKRTLGLRYFNAFNFPLLISND